MTEPRALPHDPYITAVVDALTTAGVEPTSLAEETPDEQEPTQLRWGLDDVMWGDDDTTTIMLSGPDGAPYWLELDPERAAALRDSLGGPEVPAVTEVQQPTTQTDLPDRLCAVLTERYTALGNPGSEMRYQERGPDGWPASHPVGPNLVADALRELLADGAPQNAPTAAPTVTTYLSTPCDACRHPATWHRNESGCGVAACSCSRFQEPDASTEEPTP
ncbi:hypothetical protein OHT52_21245 [Streptomyces sp. NBC_00247]|uniref:hypothetical protein n=1 Tax=Streptomyces sp. NBC_00247 TaxID=2975689 RepID=UPI002E2C35AF|nr:hypothetical protein [Streptomyces sp. NBC_00247]